MRHDSTRYYSRKNTLLAIFQSVFNPRAFLENPKSSLIINRYGWVFIFIRWLSYPILFAYRDYYGNFKPFAPPPFGMTLNTYILFQRYFSLPIGLLIMTSMALLLSRYLHIIGKEIAFRRIFNILGITFFLPFVILQPIDFIMASMGWISILTITPIHTLFLLWESYAAITILSLEKRLERIEQVTGVFILMITWIVIATILWR